MPVAQHVNFTGKNYIFLLQVYSSERYGPDKECLFCVAPECSPDRYGRGCSHRCSVGCAGPDHACHHVTGACESCNPGSYGDYCFEKCSDHCAGPDNACDRTTGGCALGCDPGFTGDKCNIGKGSIKLASLLVIRVRSQSNWRASL